MLVGKMAAMYLCGVVDWLGAGRERRMKEKMRDEELKRVRSPTGKNG